MIIHIALFTWKEEISEQDITRFLSDITNFKDKIPEIIEIYAGINFSKWRNLS